MDGKSQTPQEERIKILQSLMPEVFDEGKIDWEKLKATLGEEVNFANERYVLNWAGKGDAFRVMQQPSSATLVPCREESVDFDQTENIFIEGENMEVLKVLQKSYFGKVKMIYIDPPYNTGNDSFIYPDKFSETKEEYLRRVGDKDEDGYMTREGMFRKNSKENGQYHSNWLNMMMPRLYLAKALLREDGVVFVSIDDNEVHNLRLLMNEIFGEENFVAQIPWRKRTAKSDVPFGVSQDYEWIICFAKSERFIASIESDGRKYYEMPDLGFKVYKLSESNFKQWREIKGSNKEEWKQQVLDFINPVAESATIENMVYELLLKSGKSLNSTIEQKNGYYAINGTELILMLEIATQEVVDAVLTEHPQKVIALDNLFEDNDQLKTNTALQMRDVGVEFRTI